MASTTLRVFHARLALDDAFAKNHAGAHGAATSPWNSRAAPTMAQRVAGNYAMGDATWQGLRIRVENPAGTTREGIDPDGTPWRNLLAADYGYFAGTTGADGDGVDVFLGPYPECRSAWLINQTRADGSFDEVKAMVGFVDRSHALDAYRMSYSAGWSQFLPPIEVSAQQLRWWLTKGDTSRPFSLDLVPSEPEMTDTTINAPALPRIFWDSAAMPAAGRTLADLLYELRRHDGQDGLLLDAVTMADIREGAEVVVMDALVVQAGRLQPKMEALQRIMEAASDTVKPVALQFSDPLRRFGGVHVAVIWELSDGQTITAWFHNPDMTPAKFTPADDLVSWKWQLNKKDVTIVVAPESGRDLNTREVARRLMRLAEKNSAAFQRANAKRADAVAEIDGMKATLAQKQGELKSLLGRIEVAKVAQESLRSASQGLPDGWTVAFNNASGMYEARLRGDAFSKVGESDSFATAGEAAEAAKRWANEIDQTKAAAAAAAQAEAAAKADAEAAAAVQAAADAGAAKFTESRAVQAVVAGLSSRGWVAGEEGVSASLEVSGITVSTFNFPGDGGVLKMAIIGDGGKTVSSYALPDSEGKADRKAANIDEDARDWVAAKVKATQNPAVRVNADHQFASATDAFKAWLAKSVDEPSYSPFSSARDIDKAASAAGLRVEWDLYGGAAKMDSVTLDRADPVDVNVFQPGDKVVTQDGKDFTVLRQDGWQVSLKGKAGAVHANHLRLASGAKPKRVAMDGCGDDGDEDDFDPEAEFAAMPEAEGEAEEARQ